jgi:hypothetical protein
MFIDPHLICCSGAGYWVLGTGTGAGYWVLVLGYWVMGTGYWVTGVLGYWGTGVLGLGTGLTRKACRVQNISAWPVQKD